MICTRCNRQRKSVPATEGRTAHEKPAYGYVVHTYYGCDTGCCGYLYILASEDGREVSSEFSFDHDDGLKDDILAWAKREGVHIHWDECELRCY